ncbi:MAG: hypothetical protein U0V70_11520 [Terriglobia bacterium]
MTSVISSNFSSSPHPSQALALCQHCDMLGASAVIQPDPKQAGIIYCSICHIRFHVSTEGSRVIVLSVEKIDDRFIF